MLDGQDLSDLLFSMHVFKVWGDGESTCMTSLLRLAGLLRAKPSLQHMVISFPGFCLRNVINIEKYF